MKTLLILLITVSLPQFCHANVINVPADSSSIQAAIVGSQNGDTILVAPGTYHGDGNRDISFDGKKITVLSFGGAENTIIDCGGSDGEPHRAFNFISAEDSGSILDGFTIINGYGPIEGSYNQAGAIFLRETSPIIRNCIFDNNTGSRLGGAVVGYGAFPKFLNCTFSNDISDYGGAVYLNGESITGARDNDLCVFDNCIFHDNFALAEYGYGGAIFSQWGGSIVKITGCLLYDNHAHYGGAVAIASMSDLDLTNCTVVRNNAQFGAGLFLDGTVSAVIQNAIIAFNETGEGLFCDDLVYISLMACCDIYGNEGGDSVICLLPQSEAYGNFSLDPLFCDADADDFGLDRLSPCVPANNECDLLIGGLGMQCNIQGMCGDCNADGKVNVADAIWIINYVFLGGDPPQPVLECGDANSDGSVAISDAIWIINYIFVGGNPPGDCGGDCPAFIPR